MQIDRYGSWAALMLLAGAAGCAGNGQGLDQNGQPISAGGSSGGPVTADFQSIQDNVFTPICSKCHIGGGAPEGLQLDAAHSYNLLVGVPSVENSALDRVKPGDPDHSYMVLKIEGADGIVGGRRGVSVLEKQVDVQVNIGYATSRFVADNWQWLIPTALALAGAVAAWLVVPF